MSKILKPVVIAALLASGASMAPAIAQVRVKPVLAPTGPIKPAKEPVKPVTEPVKLATVSQAAPLTKAELQARAKPAPEHLDQSQLRAQFGKSQTTEYFAAPFSLTPAMLDVPGRGSMTIDGDVLPPSAATGPGGQAVVVRRINSVITNGKLSLRTTGSIDMTVQVAKDRTYVVDCLAEIADGEPTVYVSTYHNGGDSSVKTIKVDQQHLIFSLNEPAGGQINVSIRPTAHADSQYKPKTMDFWGCQISTTS